MTVYDIIVGFVGTPTNDLESLSIYICAGIITVIMFFSVIAIVKSLFDWK